MPTNPTQSNPTDLIQTEIRAAIPPHNLDSARSFTLPENLDAWEEKRHFIRQRILTSCGLSPQPAKAPLNPQFLKRVERDGYTIENVYFQTHPGFYLAGNLYRPHPTPQTGEMKRPGVLIAHGHWQNGRMANESAGSIAARAITFARQGYVAFTYDMIGYNDTRQVDHRFANTRRHWLWAISVMGIQTWNSIRALDFLLTLPEVDPSRLAITGESGGGTQTMMLGAIDDRLAAVGPCVMVSHTMQGGCLCENAPGLRVDISNVDIAAAAAPKFQIIVGATGDWTRDTMTMEGPAVHSVYNLLGIPDRCSYTLLDFGHNINKPSREAVYAYFGDKLLGETDATKLLEPPYTMEPVEELRVFPDDQPLPPDALDAEALTESLIAAAKVGLQSRLPHDAESLAQFQNTYRPVWEHTLAVHVPANEEILSRFETPTPIAGGTVQSLQIGRRNRHDNIPALLYTPTVSTTDNVVVLADIRGKSRFYAGSAQKPSDLIHGILAAGVSVLTLDLFLTGERADVGATAARNVPFHSFFSTYNRTDAQERVQDLITAITYLRSQKDGRTVTLVGFGRAGLLALLAAPVADAVAADCKQLDLTTDDALLADDLFIPCLRHMGDFVTATLLAAPHPVYMFHTGDAFTAADTVATIYAALGHAPLMRRSRGRITGQTLTNWIKATTIS